MLAVAQTAVEFAGPVAAVSGGNAAAAAAACEGDGAAAAAAAAAAVAAACEGTGAASAVAAAAAVAAARGTGVAVEPAPEGASPLAVSCLEEGSFCYDHSGLPCVLEGVSEAREGGRCISGTANRALPNWTGRAVAFSERPRPDARMQLPRLW